MAKTTPATLWLEKLGIPFERRSYDYDPGAASIGLQAAQALGEPASRVFKTLVVQVDAKPACVLAPSDSELSMKKVAAALGGKSAAMMPPADAERITGYKVGGVSPFGQKRPLPTVIARQALDEPYIYLNGGQRGLQVRMAPVDAQRASDAISADVTA